MSGRGGNRGGGGGRRGGRGRNSQSEQQGRGGGRRGTVEAPVVPFQVSASSSSGTSLSSSPTNSSVAPASSSKQHGPASSSSVAAVSAEVEQKLQLPEDLNTPARPGFGTIGRKMMVRSNHFLVEVKDRDLYHYDVSITPEITTKRLNKIVLMQLDSLYRDTHLGSKRLAYDGRKSLYSAGPLPFESKDFVVKLVDKESTRKERQFKVTIKLASRPDLHQLREYLCKKQADVPYEVIQALDVVLRMKPSEEFVSIGSSFYSPVLGSRGKLGEGVEYWGGYYQSLRLTQLGFSLNVDVSARSFYEPILVSEFISSYLNIRDLSRPLSEQDCVKIKKALRSVRVELAHWDFARTCKISGISSRPISELTFTLDDKQTKKTVLEYFHENYNTVVRYPNLPAIQAGSDSKPIYYPMELCKIAEGQRYTKKLNERQVTAMLKATCQRPDAREGAIIKMVTGHGCFKDKLVKDEFGILVNEVPTMVEARVLPPPMLKYHDTGRDTVVNPMLGQWNMINKKMINGGRVDYWTCVNFSSRLQRHIQSEFCHQLIGMCVSKGMQFNEQPVIPLSNSSPYQIEKTLLKIHQEATAKLQLLIIILPDNTGSYGKIKRICETDLGIVSQCCQPRQASKLSKQYMENVALKINVKVGGRNTVLNDAIRRNIPLVTDVPTIIIGADVTHPQAGEDSGPSIAAVVASMDWPEISKYRALVSAQPHRQEIIEDLYKTVQDPHRGLVHSGLIRELFIAFRKSTGHRPYRIIFYRDGVSEGQFSQVLSCEMEAIRKACKSLEPGYQPRVTFVVVQKRHHTRLFPANHGNRSTTDKSGNIQPGTVVDTKICHPHEFDFFLNSHAGIQGTSRPAHYHVLFDENHFSADALQVLTNNLCYTYARCTRSVSIVPPVYYAHLAAFRARYYVEGEPGLQLPAIKDNVKDVMFYC